MIGCIRCGKVPVPVFPKEESPLELTRQPYEATYFTTTGHYGSTVFDEMDGTYLYILICDKCLVEASREDRVVHVTPEPPVRQTAAEKLWYWDYEGEE